MASKEKSSNNKNAANFKYKSLVNVRANKYTESSMDVLQKQITGEDTNYDNILSDDLSDLERSLDHLASTQIGKIIDDSYRAFASIDRFAKLNVFRYFYKTNPIIGRSLELHTDLPLSKIRLTPPKNAGSEIVKDYINYYYNSIFNKVDIFKFLRDFVLTYRIYGEAFALVEDGYGSTQNNLELVSEDRLNDILGEKMATVTQEDQKFIDEINKKYETDSKSVSVSDRDKYLKIVFPLYNKAYKGIDRISVIDFFKINSYFKNYSSSYKALELRVDPQLRDNIGSITEEEVAELGITKSFYDLVKHELTTNKTNKTLEIDNNPYKKTGNTSYIFELGNDSPESSLVNRVIDQAFEFEALKAAVRTKIILVGKIGRVVTAEGIGEEELSALQADLAYMAENPDSEVVLNYNVNIQEFNSTVKDDLKELISDYDRIKEEISMGLGLPMSLLGGDSQFSGEVLKLEIMNNEYLNFRNLLTRVIEDCLLKPIAIRKGFYKTNEWGDIELIYPSISFSRTSLRSESQYDLLFSMYKQNSIPSSVIYELLNMDHEAISKDLKKEMFSVKNPNFGDMLSSVYSSIASELGQNPEVINKLKESMGLASSNDADTEDTLNESDSSPRLGDLKYAKPPKKSDSDYEIEDTGDKKFQRPDIKKNLKTENRFGPDDL